jgi:hypothetical protein
VAPIHHVLDHQIIYFVFRFKHLPEHQDMGRTPSAPDLQADSVNKVVENNKQDNLRGRRLQELRLCLN